VGASDFVASLRPWSIEDIQIGDRLFRIPALAADRWLELLLPDEISLWSLLPGLLEQADAEEYLSDLMLVGDLDRDEYEEITWEVVGIAAGREWWVALHLLGNAKAEHNTRLVRGQLVLAGVDATKISLAAFLDAVYMIFIQNMTEQNRQRFDMMLNMAPPGVKRAINPERQRANFAALLGNG